MHKKMNENFTKTDSLTKMTLNYIIDIKLIRRMLRNYKLFKKTKESFKQEIKQYRMYFARILRDLIVKMC